MKVRVSVQLKPGILDPQGKAVEQGLHGFGFAVDHVRIGRRPAGAKRSTAALGVEVEDRYAVMAVGQLVGDGQGRVGAGVVGDHHPAAEREILQPCKQSFHARPQRGLLVEYRARTPSR